MLWSADLQIFTEEAKCHFEKPRSALPGSAILRGLTDPENIDIKIFKTSVNTGLSLKNGRI
jgi:hypothetical protein